MKTVVMAAGAAGVCCGGLGCGADDAVAGRVSAVVYGADDRREYFDDVAAPEARARMAESLVALVPKARLARTERGLAIDAPSWADAAGLCADEAFAAQPAAAFCTGVLVDWDLVVTAGHCMRLFALRDIAIVFGYHYVAPDRLALDGTDDVREPIAIVAEALDPAGAEPRLDYAWIRLNARASPPRRPAPIHVRAPAIAVGDPVTAMGAPGGVPMKLDAGGRVAALRALVADYFTADTDTSHGSSGGGAFDAGLGLVGILARGAEDLIPPSADGSCARMVRREPGAPVEEEFTYAHRAVEGLCATPEAASSLCRPECANPCEALPFPDGSGGCAVGGNGRAAAAPAVLLAAAMALGAFRRRRRRPCYGPGRWQQACCGRQGRGRRRRSSSGGSGGAGRKGLAVPKPPPDGC